MFKTITIDSTNHKTDLCDLATKYKCDKGPFSEGSVNMGHRKGYTAVYNILFSPLRNKPINFFELGLQHGDSIKLFKEYFSDIEYYGIDNNDGSIAMCTAMDIPRTHYYKVNVSHIESLEETVQSMDAQFDVILDDSSHVVTDQHNIIQVGAKYLKSGGLLIIEDLERNWPEDIYAPIQDFINENFSFETFIIAHHDNRECWDNDKLWIGIKK
jgi:SAM-dependent methyltransferase